MSPAKALRPIRRGNGTRPRGNSGAVSSSDPGRSVYFVYRAHRDLLKGSTARELGWRLAPHKTIEARERAPAGFDRNSLPLLADTVENSARPQVAPKYSNRLGSSGESLFRVGARARIKLASRRRQIVFQRHRPFSDIPKDADQSALGPRMDMGRPS
jgi:hypothetical protein